MLNPELGRKCPLFFDYVIFKTFELSKVQGWKWRKSFPRWPDIQYRWISQHCFFLSDVDILLTMDLDPTENGALHIYIWNQLKKRIEKEIALWVIIMDSWILNITYPKEENENSKGWVFLIQRRQWNQHWGNRFVSTAKRFLPIKIISHLKEQNQNIGEDGR